MNAIHIEVTKKLIKNNLPSGRFLKTIINVFILSYKKYLTKVNYFIELTLFE